MHLLSRFVAVATLASTALAGATLAPTGAAATPAGAPAIQRPAGATQAPPVRVTITVAEDGSIRRSLTGFRPGATIFDIRSAGSGSVELLRLHDGYSLKELQGDFGGIFNGNLKKIRRIDRNVEFYGGTFVEKGEAPSFATRLDAGQYYLVNLDRGTWRTLRVTGKVQQRWMPVSHGPINMVGEHDFSEPRRMHHSGWMRSTNKTDEPHFVELAQVKESTTAAKVRRYFASGANGDPSWALPGHGGTLVIGAGHTVAWSYDVPRGKYLTMCFWPSDENGMPHAAMGMWKLAHLR
ncbi:hypothetical protein FB382_004291 [Nocardioides ginsengisegetis]|uniref:Uncharacterized protein n=1 Tax=Nocardioides ginsengisegetis TaxID=661491 RepID=A0A7W3PBV1_9ACTN|nr:hypothetical protein [Nocardioides ginsengisegetis]MBA8805946.1 hypothetical protein [Nocardioides ginsengisegetis]